jgi:antitoxin component YwqK of YwqJK toxin-antitoxin module
MEQIIKGEAMMKKNIIIFMLFLILTCLGNLFAQGYDEDQQTMQQYILPQGAILESTLTVKDTISYLGDKPFSGTAYSLYPGNKMQLSAQYKNGMKHGILYVWYPDGKPQLLSYYKYGHLNGRFKGWYPFGGIIYDLVMSYGHYTGDAQIDADATRSQTDSADSDSGGDGKDQSNGE